MPTTAHYLKRIEYADAIPNPQARLVALGLVTLDAAEDEDVTNDEYLRIAGRVDVLCLQPLTVAEIGGEK